MDLHLENLRIITIHSNGLVNKMLQSASPEIKTGMETLLDGGTITVNFDEQIVFEQLEKDENAI